MPTQDDIRICIDRSLPDDVAIETAEIAIAENPVNRPAIQFTPGLGVGPLSRLDLAALTGKKWGNGRTLRVSFLDGDSDVQAKVKTYANVWSDYANIKFDFGNDPNAEIRISFKLKGSWSYIGTDCLGIPKDEPTMNFGWLTPASTDDEYSRVVTHEFGHALGCYHEHQHPGHDIPWDKEAVYEYFMGPPNNWSKAQVDINLFQKYSATISQFSKFDKSSIMLYSISNQFTIGDYEVGWNRELSEIDKDFIGVMYPKVVKKLADLEIDDAPLRASIGAHGEEDYYTTMVEFPGNYRIETGGWTDVVMYLYGPDDPKAFIAMDDDSGFWHNARINAELNPGKYFVMVRHFRPRRKGRYSIAVRLRK
jgi:hypothetical protein